MFAEVRLKEISTVCPNWFSPLPVLRMPSIMGWVLHDIQTYQCPDSKWTVFGDSSLILWWFALHPCQPLCVLPLCVLDSFHQLIKDGAIFIKHNRFAHLIWCELEFFHELLIHCVVNKCIVWHRVKQIKVSCSS